MRVYEVIGVDRVSGVSRKTNQPYDMTTIHLTYEDPEQKTLVGKGVMEIKPWRDVLDRSGYYPTVGDLVTLQFDVLSSGMARLSGIQKWDG